MATEPTTDLFRQRARAEAARYGSDPWVFIRELLQNARDAGARRVQLDVSNRGGCERVSCRDDGCGMSYQHARRYLFALYASSKEDNQEQAGKFGIGFWSVLRFEPSTITIRSHASRQRGANQRGDAWQVSLDGALGNVEESAADLDAGTEIVLERPAREGEDLAAEVMAATRHYGRFVTRRDDPETPLPVTVNGRSANAELKLEAPCATFRGKGFRGAVGLGAEPEVELFAQGLFVRAASSLQDLQAAGELSDEAASSTEDVLAELPSLAPRVLIDSSELDLLLARSDARYDKHLRRILRTSEKQLSRLITRQLQALRPQPFYRLWLGALRDRLEPYVGWHLATSGLVGLVLGLMVLWWLPTGWLGEVVRDGVASVSSRPGGTRSEAMGAASEQPRSPRAVDLDPSKTSGRSVLPPGGGPGDEPPLAAGSGGPGVASGANATGMARATPGVLEGAGAGASGWAIHAYRDLGDHYLGPQPGGLADDRSRLAMVYEPAEATPFFAALVIDDLSASRWTPSSAADLRPYRGVPCVSKKACVESRLLVAGGQTAVRIPVPTGHRLDTGSVRFDGGSGEVFETSGGEALLGLPKGSQGVVSYRTGPEPSMRTTEGSRMQRPKPPLDAPAELIEVAEDLRHLPVDHRIQRALDYIVERVVYDTSPDASGRYRFAGSGESSFVEIALEAGRGDCDVQSGVLVTLLRLAGVEARLALGYVGLQGTVAPGLHAWAEVRDSDGVWSVADPSITSGDASGAPLLPMNGAARFPSRTEVGSPWVPMVPLAAALLLGVAAWSLKRRSVGGIELSVGPGEEQPEHLAALLGGALRHPEAFASLPAMFHGRFVPLLSRRGSHPGRGQYISLARARRAGSKNRLFRSISGSDLARRAAARGVSVIDASTAEGRVLSLALGAIDVDHWSNLLERSSRSMLSRRINTRLDELGAFFRLREAASLAEPWTEIALEDLKLGRRQIVIDPSHLEYAPVRALIENHPEAAAFTMLDVLLHRIELPENERSRLLAVFAGQAVDEAARVASGDVVDAPQS